MFAASKKWFLALHPRVFATAAIIASAVAVGLTQSLLNTTKLDLRIAVNVTEKDASLLFPAHDTGYAIGVLMVMFFGQHVNLMWVMIICQSGVGLITGCIPFIGSIQIMVTTFFINGVMIGMNESSNFALVLFLWGSDAVLPLVGVNTMYAVGSALGPILARPFLLDESLVDVSQLVAADIELIAPYMIGAATMAVTAMALIAAVFWTPANEPHPSRATSSDSDGQVDGPMKYLCIFLALGFNHFFEGMRYTQVMHSISYSMRSAHRLSKAHGADNLAANWTFYIVVNIISLFVVKVIGLRKNILLRTFFFAFGITIYSVFGHCYVWGFWMATLSITAGSCTMISSVTTYLETAFPVSTRLASMIILAATFGDIIWPLIVGLFIEEDSHVYIYVVAGCGVMAIVLVLMLVVLIGRVLEREQVKAENVEHVDDKQKDLITRL